MNLLNLMEADYVKDRYELDSIEIIAPKNEGEAVIVIGLLHDSEINVFIASGKTEGSALVNLAVAINGECDVDVVDHIVGYYSELPKYKDVDYDELYKFSDSLMPKFRAGENITGNQFSMLQSRVINYRQQYSDSYVIVRASDMVKEYFKGVYESLTFDPIDSASRSWCAICDEQVAIGEDFCEKCSSRMKSEI